MVMCDALIALELPGWAGPLVEACRSSGEDIDTAVKLAEHYARLLPQPAAGRRRSAGQCWPRQASKTSRSPGLGGA